MAGIELKGIHKSYPVDGRLRPVLRGLDLDIPAGRITVVLGKSGCGKTTLLRLAGGLESFEQGRVHRAEALKSAFVFQEPRLMPWLSVRRNVAFGLEKKKTTPQQIQQIIETVGLSGFENAYPHQLSGGMQQRAALARALAYAPDFLMMDEPFAALDHFTREQMQRELLRVQAVSGCGILFVTHSMDEALLLGDQIVVMEQGLIRHTHHIDRIHTRRDLLEPAMLELKRDILQHLEIA